MIQVFHCSDCGFHFGPVGVKPYVPDAPTHQLFLECMTCNSPAVLNADPRNITAACEVCTDTNWGNLDECPECRGANANWKSPEEVANEAHARMRQQQAAAAVEANEDAAIQIEYAKTGGCLMLVLGVFSLGVAPLTIWLSQRKWPVFADGAGVVLKNGKHIPWKMIIRVIHLTTNVGGTVVHKYTFETSGGGEWSLPYERLLRPQEVVEFILTRVPASARRMEN